MFNGLDALENIFWNFISQTEKHHDPKFGQWYKKRDGAARMRWLRLKLRVAPDIWRLHRKWFAQPADSRIGRAVCSILSPGIRNLVGNLQVWNLMLKAICLFDWGCLGLTLPSTIICLKTKTALTCTCIRNKGLHRMSVKSPSLSPFYAWEHCGSEVEKLTQGHTAERWNQGLNVGIC